MLYANAQKVYYKLDNLTKKKKKKEKEQRVTLLTESIVHREMYNIFVFSTVNVQFSRFQIPRVIISHHKTMQRIKKTVPS